jgi:hypothetical protein
MRGSSAHLPDAVISVIFMEGDLIQILHNGDTDAVFVGGTFNTRATGAVSLFFQIIE